MNESEDTNATPPSDKDGLSALVEEILAERKAELADTVVFEDAVADVGADAGGYAGAESPVESDESAEYFEIAADDAGEEAVAVEAAESVETDIFAPAVEADFAPKTKFSWSRSKKILVGAGALAVMYGGLVLVVGSGIPSGTRVGDINVGRMSVEAARAALAPAATEFAQKNITLSVAGNKSKDTIADFGLAYDVDATLAQIPTGSLNPFDLLSAVFSGRTVQPVITESDQLTAALTELADAVDHPAIDTTISIKTGEPLIVPGKTGKVLDVSSSRQAIVDAVNADPFAEAWAIKLALVPDNPDVTKQDAQKLIDTVVTPALSADVTISTTAAKGASTAVYTPKKIAKAMRFTVEDGKLLTHLDPRTIRTLTDEKFSGVETPVQNATWNVSSGKPVIVPSKPGFGVTDRALASAIESVYTLPEGQRTAEVEFGVIKPSFSTSAAEKAGVTELLASYTQRFPYAPYRVTNIGRAAKYIDGTYLAPGAEYSMNGTIKERTYENGYTDGWIIGGGGVFKMEPGGGVSTATTAMFNGAFFSGMQFLEWRAHSIWIPDRYVAGREATVFWGSLDMRFKNPAPTGVFITTYMSNTSVTVKFWGTKQWEKIESVSGEKRNISQSRVIENDQPDCHEQNAVIGFRITVERVFYKDGAEVKREPFNTTYRAAPEVKCTYKAPPTKKPTPKPTKTTKKPTVTPSPSTSATP